MRYMLYLFLGVLLSLPAQAILTDAECQKKKLSCDVDQGKVFEVALKWSIYKDCLAPSVRVPGRCRGELIAYITTWNEFVDNCTECVSSDSPLQGCPLYDQNMLCPPKLQPLKSIE